MFILRIRRRPSSTRLPYTPLFRSGLAQVAAKLEAAAEAVKKTQIPLLGATVIGIMAFSGIGLSNDSTGEFMFSLFAVIGISLLLSWVLAVTVTPLLASYLFGTGASEQGRDPYDTFFFRAYGSVVRGALRLRWLVIIALIGATVAGVGAMGFVKQQFFVLVFFSFLLSLKMGIDQKWDLPKSHR